MKAILTFAPLFRRVAASLVLTLALSLVSLAAGVALLGLSGWFLTAAALSTAGSAFNLFGPSAGVRGLSFLRILSRYGEKLSGHDATLKLLSDLRRWLFARLFPLVPLGRRFGRADLVSRLIADIDALDTMFLVAIGPLVTTLVAGAGMTILLALLLPGAALWYGPALIVLALVPVALIVISRQANRDIVAASADLRRAMLDGIDGHQDIVLFDASGEVLHGADAASRGLAAARRRLSVMGGLASAAVQAIAGATLVATLLTGLDALQLGQIDGPLFVGLLLAVIASFEPAAMLVRSASRLSGSAAAADRLRDIADAAPLVADPADPVELPRGGNVTFDNVTFGYDRRFPVLLGLSLSIDSGRCVAIRGPSGGGKSTIAHLLLRLADPNAGTIRINGVDIRATPLAELRRRVALMTQDAPVFNDSVRANLLIGRPDASDADLWAVLAAVRLDDAIRALPGGLDAVLGEAGRSLSAGQARRICLARTLLSDAAIIVIDEPTAGLDRETEAAFLTDLPHLAHGRTMIVITHADIPDGFDQIFNLAAGRLREPRHAAA